MGTPTLVVEILSPSTRQKDMVDKLRSYMLGGVEEYWIIDPDNRKVLLYSFAERNIRDLSEYRLGEVVQSACFQAWKYRCPLYSKARVSRERPSLPSLAFLPFQLVLRRLSEKAAGCSTGQKGQPECKQPCSRWRNCGGFAAE